MKKSYFIIIPLSIIWLIGMFRDFDNLSKKKDNPNYILYLSEYQDSVKREYNKVTKELSQEFQLEFTGEMGDFDVCKITNFEGAEVKIAGIKYFNRKFFNKSHRGEKGFENCNVYRYDCNEIGFDPDHEYYGLPNVNVTVGPVEYYTPEESSFKRLFSKSKDKENKPYKTYQKQIIEIDTLTGNAVSKTLLIDLWLTTFNVLVKISPTSNKDIIKPTEEERNMKLFPAAWYGAGRGLVSINEFPHLDENDDQFYRDLTISFEINPNASPWYIKHENIKSPKPMIAVGGIFCKHYNPKVPRKKEININTFAGSAEPLYFSTFELSDSISSKNLSTEKTAILRKYNEFNRLNIWDRKYYFRLWTDNLGSRRKLLGLEQQNDQLEFEFLVPLLVIGDLEVTIPKNILPEWNPPEPKVRSFSLKNLLPRFGLKSGIISVFLIIIIGGLALNIFFPFLKILK